jgi:hypothetical protein
MLFNSYSERTKCPACRTKIRLEDVRFTPTFSCPACQEEIQVSPSYQKTWRIMSYCLGLLPAYILGRETFYLVLLLWVLFTFIIGFLWLYFVKYWVPPKLARCVSDRGHFQGLGLGPK